MTRSPVRSSRRRSWPPYARPSPRPSRSSSATRSGSRSAFDARLAETPEELESILTPLAAAGVDAFHASTRRYWLPEFDGSDLNLAGWTKKLTGKPTVTVGSVGLDGDFMRGFAGEGSPLKSIDDLLDRLEHEEFDLVAVGRALLQDPEWAAKVLGGQDATS